MVRTLSPDTSGLAELQARLVGRFGAGEGRAALEGLEQMGGLAPPESPQRHDYFEAKINIVGFRRKDRDSALDLCRQATGEFPGDRVLWFLQGRTLAELGQD